MFQVTDLRRFILALLETGLFAYKDNAKSKAVAEGPQDALNAAFEERRAKLYEYFNYQTGFIRDFDSETTQIFSLAFVEISIDLASRLFANFKKKIGDIPPHFRTHFLEIIAQAERDKLPLLYFFNASFSLLSNEDANIAATALKLLIDTLSYKHFQKILLLRINAIIMQDVVLSNTTKAKITEVFNFSMKSQNSSLLYFIDYISGLADANPSDHVLIFQILEDIMGAKLYLEYTQAVNLITKMREAIKIAPTLKVEITVQSEEASTPQQKILNLVHTYFQQYLAEAFQQEEPWVYFFKKTKILMTSSVLDDKTRTLVEKILKQVFGNKAYEAYSQILGVDTEQKLKAAAELSKHIASRGLNTEFEAHIQGVFNFEALTYIKKFMEDSKAQVKFAEHFVKLVFAALRDEGINHAIRIKIANIVKNLLGMMEHERVLTSASEDEVRIVALADKFEKHMQLRAAAYLRDCYKECSIATSADVDVKNVDVKVFLEKVFTDFKRGKVDWILQQFIETGLQDILGGDNYAAIKSMHTATEKYTGFDFIEVFDITEAGSLVDEKTAEALAVDETIVDEVPTPTKQSSTWINAAQDTIATGVMTAYNTAAGVAGNAVQEVLTSPIVRRIRSAPKLPLNAQDFTLLNKKLAERLAAIDGGMISETSEVEAANGLSLAALNQIQPLIVKIFLGSSDREIKQVWQDFYSSLSDLVKSEAITLSDWRFLTAIIKNILGTENYINFFASRESASSSILPLPSSSAISPNFALPLKLDDFTAILNNYDEAKIVGKEAEQREEQREKFKLIAIDAANLAAKKAELRKTHENKFKPIANEAAAKAAKKAATKAATTAALMRKHWEEITAQAHATSAHAFTNSIIAEASLNSEQKARAKAMQEMVAAFSKKPITITGTSQDSWLEFRRSLEETSTSVAAENTDSPSPAISMPTVVSEDAPVATPIEVAVVPNEAVQMNRKDSLRNKLVPVLNSLAEKQRIVLHFNANAIRRFVIKTLNAIANKENPVTAKEFLEIYHEIKTIIAETESLNKIRPLLDWYSIEGALKDNLLKLVTIEKTECPTSYVVDPEVQHYLESHRSWYGFMLSVFGYQTASAAKLAEILRPSQNCYAFFSKLFHANVSPKAEASSAIPQGGDEVSAPTISV